MQKSEWLQAINDVKRGVFCPDSKPKKLDLERAIRLIQADALRHAINYLSDLTYGRNRLLENLTAEVEKLESAEGVEKQ